MRSNRWLLALCLLFSFGCSGASPVITGSWEMIWFEEDGDRQEVEVGLNALRPVSFSLSETRLRGFAGCNQVVGRYTVRGHEITPESFGGTRSACRSEAEGADPMAAETALEAIFTESSFTYELHGETMTWTGEHWSIGFERP